MKDTNFTPGKWMVCEDDFGEPFVENESGDPVCEVCGTTDDARLIAAAPDLYEALVECVDRIDTFYGPPGSNRIDHELIVRARAALAKAKGET